MPRKSGEKMILKQFFIHPSLFNELRLYADQHNLSVSFIVRYLIAEFLDKNLGLFDKLGASDAVQSGLRRS